MRKSFDKEFMARVALEAIREEKTIAVISSQYEVHRAQIVKWRKRAMEGIAGIFEGKESKGAGEKEKVTDELYRQIGQLKVENEWLKKNLERLGVKEKRGLIEPDNEEISVRRQCELIGLNRSNVYYEPVGITEETLRLMHRVDEIFTEYPFYGSRRIQETLVREGVWVGRERVQRCMREMGLRAIYPKRSLSKRHPGHKIYPYLLRDKEISRPNEVWATDITYQRLKRGFVYLTAIIDWYSRYVLSWRISNTMEVTFCAEALESALEKGSPEIFNSDQGSQFTSDDFTGILLRKGIAISMDGRGRAFDNIFTERLWRSVKYEEVYLKEYQVCRDAREGLEKYFTFYNIRRYYQSLEYKIPYEVHFGVSSVSK